MEIITKDKEAFCVKISWTEMLQLTGKAYYADLNDVTSGDSIDIKSLFKKYNAFMERKDLLKKIKELSQQLQLTCVEMNPIIKLTENETDIPKRDPAENLPP